MKKIASVAVMVGERLLIGKRSDDQRWNLPGGHVDEGETPVQGAIRELEEETGIKAKASDLVLLCDPQKVNTFTGKTIEVYSYLLVLPKMAEVTQEGEDEGEAHDWYWTNISNGIPADIAQNWHNKTDATMDALGLPVCTNDAFDKSAEELFDLEKAWPKHYNRVKGQTKDKGVASKKQLNYMKAKAAEGDKDAKAYVANSSGADSLPESGTGGARGERENHKEKTKKADKSVVKLGADVAYMKEKYGEKKPKSFNQQVTDIKAKYKKPMEKSSDLFYAKVEGLLEKGYHNEELLSHMMDIEVHLRKNEDEDGLNSLYKSAENLFDAAMSKEEQAVYELSYMAKEGCEDSHDTLVKFAEEMYAELVKHSPIEDVVGDMVLEALGKSNYGPKGMGQYTDVHNINRKAKRTGIEHPDVGRNVAEQKFTPSVQGTFAEQAKREAKADQKKNKAQPVKVLSDEEKAAYQASLKAKNPDKKIASEDDDDMVEEHTRLVHVLRSPSHKDDKREARIQAEELEDYKDKANKSEDNSKVKGKVNGASYRMVHGYKRYTSGPKRGEYVHRHEAEKRIGRKLSTKEHVDHVDGKRSGTKNTKVMSASEHSAKTNKTRAGKGYSGSKRYEHTRD